MKTIFNGENNYSFLEVLKLLYRSNHKKNKGLLKKDLFIYHSREFKLSFFTSGRSSLFKLLVSLNYKKKFKVGLQAFTCSVVPKAIIDAGGMPIYIDLEIETLSMDIEELKKKIRNLDVIILQYTFGFTPKYLRSIVNLCKERSKILILDKAHCMPEILNEEVYNLESMSYGIFYSTDHTKAINAIRGGICFSKKKIHFPSIYSKQIKINLPFLYESIFYKEFLYILARISSLLMRIFCFSYMPQDNSDIRILSNENVSLSWYTIVLDQLRKSKKRSINIKKFSFIVKESFNNKKLCKPLFNKELLTTPLRLPILFDNKENKDKFLNALIRENIKLSDWFGGVLTCQKKEYKFYEYNYGDCPIAENISERVVGIPCNKRFRDERFTFKLNKVLKKII